MKKILLAIYTFNTGKEKGKQYAAFETLEDAIKGAKAHIKQAEGFLEESENEWHKETPIISVSRERQLGFYEEKDHNVKRHELCDIIDYHVPEPIGMLIQYGEWGDIIDEPIK